MFINLTLNELFNNLLFPLITAVVSMFLAYFIDFLKKKLKTLDKYMYFMVEGIIPQLTT